MIQDISPSRLRNEYFDCRPGDGDRIYIFNKDGKVLLGDENGRIIFPDYSDIKDENCIYLFSVDDERFFLSPDNSEHVKEGFEYYTIREVRDKFSDEFLKEIYAVFTAFHLWRWYADNKYCGRCKGELKPGEKERSLVCPDCGNVIYPRINPAVIVGVTKGDSILITKYRRGYGHSALVAGFTEIGETLEETVKREVKEETGVDVTNIRYYKSQPWGMAQDMLIGFYCDAAGDGAIHMDEGELKYAEWVKREDIELQPNNLSLTNEMMRMFKEGKC